MDCYEVIFDLENKKKRFKELEKLMGKQDFWSDQESAREVLKERSGIVQTIQRVEELEQELEDAEILLQMSVEEDDEETLREVKEKIKELDARIRQLEMERMFSGPDDDKNAILNINAGAGGTEAQDWAEMLLRMFLRWAEKKGFETRIIDLQPGEEAGIKSATVTISGKYAYGMLKSETGIHRLVRISPFDASGRRHTSFAAVSVFPEVTEDIVIEIKPSELRIDTYRASGAGGQHVNKTSSAVRITHLPTGIVVQCQNEKSQHRNKDMAMKVLRARLYELEKRKQMEKKQQIHESMDEIAWGSQIRSYILQPYRLVKDHRTQVEVGDVNSVLDGDIDRFIEAYLLAGNKSGETKK